MNRPTIHHVVADIREARRWQKETTFPIRDILDFAHVVFNWVRVNNMFDELVGRDHQILEDFTNKQPTPFDPLWQLCQENDINLTAEDKYLLVDRYFQD